MTMEPRANIEYLERICRLKDARIKELEARVAELERRLSGEAGGTPWPAGPANDPRPIKAYLDPTWIPGGRGGGGQG